MEHTQEADGDSADPDWEDNEEEDGKDEVGDDDPEYDPEKRERGKKNIWFCNSVSALEYRLVSEQYSTNQAGWQKISQQAKR